MRDKKRVIVNKDILDILIEEISERPDIYPLLNDCQGVIILECKEFLEKRLDIENLKDFKKYSGVDIESINKRNKELLQTEVKGEFILSESQQLGMMIGNVLEWWDKDHKMRLHVEIERNNIKLSKSSGEIELIFLNIYIPTLIEHAKKAEMSLPDFVKFQIQRVLDSEELR